LRTARRAGMPALLVTLGVLPVFLLSSLAVFVRTQLGFSESRLGISIAANFLASALMSAPAGRLTQRIGSRRGFATGCVLVGIGLVGMAAARSWAVLTAWLVVAGVGNAFMQVSANLRIARTVDAARHGFAFGFKQSAVPAATLLAGAAVPLLGLTLGWRAAFGLAALALAVAAAGLVRRRAEGAAPSGLVAGGPPAVTAPIVVLTAGICLAAGAATGLSTFLVEFAVSTGWRPGPAGVLLAAGSGLCILARLAFGWHTDRFGGDGLRLVAAQLVGGAVAVVLLAFSAARPVVLVPAVLVAFALGWGWSGLFNHAIVSRSGGAPARVTGVTQIGIYAGGALGPLLFGFVVTNATYRLAWLLTAAGMAAAAVLIVAGRRLAGSAPLAAAP